jgi:ProP effector
VDLGGTAVGEVSAEDAVRARNSESNRAAKAARKSEQAATSEQAPAIGEAPAGVAPAAEQTAEPAVAPERASASDS